MVTKPMDGETISDPKPLIKANLATMGDIDQGSVEMRISGLGPVAVKYDAASKTAEYQVPKKLREPEYTVFISAKSKAKRLETKWNFKYDPTAAPLRRPIDGSTCSCPIARGSLHALTLPSRRSIKDSRPDIDKPFGKRGSALISAPRISCSSLLADKLQDVFKDSCVVTGRSRRRISRMRCGRCGWRCWKRTSTSNVAKRFIARVKEKALGEEVLRGVALGQQIVKISPR